MIVVKVAVGMIIDRSSLATDQVAREGRKAKRQTYQIFLIISVDTSLIMEVWILVPASG